MASSQHSMLAERLMAWVDDVQLSNQTGFPHYQKVAELKTDIRSLVEQFEVVQRVAKEAVAYYIADVVPDPAQMYVDDWCKRLGVTREELDALYWDENPIQWGASSPASEPETYGERMRRLTASQPHGTNYPARESNQESRPE